MGKTDRFAPDEFPGRNAERRRCSAQAASTVGAAIYRCSRMRAFLMDLGQKLGSEAERPHETRSETALLGDAP